MMADLGLISLAGIWGVNFSVVKVVLLEMDPFALNALRFPMAALAFWLVLRSRPGPRRPMTVDVPRILILGLVGNVAYQVFFIQGLNLTLAGNASLLLATTPIWTLALSTLAGHERPTLRVVSGIGITLVGVGLVIAGRSGGSGVGASSIVGDLLMLGAAVLWSGYTVWGRTPVATYGPLRMTAWSLWIATPVIVLMGVPSLRSMDLGSVSAGAWLGVVYAGVISIAVAYVLWYRGVQLLGNSRTAVYSNLVPVAALLVAWAWLGETPTAPQLVGAAIILTGLWISRTAQMPGPSSLRWRSSGNS
ncbi:MAG: DMT family transporter [Thioalkalivibrio sp.]|nr:DMT family transporter [Thioalkalivibrio sp.]